MTHRNWIAVAGAGALLIGLPLVWSFAKIDAGHRRLAGFGAPAAVQADASPRAARLVAGGQVEPVSGRIALSSDVPGRISAIRVDEGDLVKAGDVLVEIANDDLRAMADAAAATVRLREAEFARLMNGARPEERQQAVAQMQEAEASLGLAQRIYNRQEASLFARRLVSAERFDQVRSSKGVAEARRAQAKAVVARVSAPPRPEDVDAGRAGLALARANLAAARAQVERTRIRSPIDGIVLRRYRSPGEAAGGYLSSPILDVGDTRRLRVRAQIAERDVGALAVGQHATVTAAAYPAKEFRGRVTRVGLSLGRRTTEIVDPAIQLDTTVLDVVIDLDDGVRLPIGLRVDVFIDAMDSR